MATAKTNEAAFEEAIEHDLLGLGYIKGEAGDFDKALAINTKMLFSFLEATQAKELARLKGYDWKKRVLDKIQRLIKLQGTLYVLRHPLIVDNIEIVLFYPKPQEGGSTRESELYRANVWGITRQQSFSQTNARLRIDCVIFLNGLPLFTLELKNTLTEQTAKDDGIRQYRADRDPSEPLLRFGVCLAHMAVDDKEVWMTTRLERENTRFIPFNKGKPDGSGGNPPKAKGETGFATDYLWLDIFSPDTLSDIITNFAMLEFEEGDPDEQKKGLVSSANKQSLNSAKSLIFPRYHQLEAVRKLCRDASKNGVGQRYLIQHSAGSGKSNTITWLAYKLVSLRPSQKRATIVGGVARDHLKPVFDTVLVVTDRRLLDTQITSCINAFGGSLTIHEHATTSNNLKDLIVKGHRIITTTIEKFPKICSEIASMKERTFAVLIDEAHSSQSGKYAHDMVKALEGDIDQVVDEVSKNPKLGRNTSFFAFTATPKQQTLEKFGTKGEDGTFRPFHLYSMKQAIEEHFILDVTRKYISYKCLYELYQKKVDSSTFDKQRLKATLKRLIAQDEEALFYKAQFIVDHFEGYVKHKLMGQSRAMVVAYDITSAILYYRAIYKLCFERELGYLPVIAFSGTKKIGGEDLSESIINEFEVSRTTELFNKGCPKDKQHKGHISEEDIKIADWSYRILVVANKYLTGFDQKKLCAMYVDKPLAGVQAVQTLSRLNRTASDLDKRTDDLAIIDFCNGAQEIQKAFSRFYTSVNLVKASDPEELEKLYDEIMSVGMFTSQDVDAFALVYYRRGATQADYSSYIDNAADAFDKQLGLSEEEKCKVKGWCVRYVKVYDRLSAHLDKIVAKWDKLFEFLCLLIKEIKTTQEDTSYGISVDVLKQYVGVDNFRAKKRMNKDGEIEEIKLDDSGAKLESGKGGTGKEHGERSTMTIEELIEEFNKLFEGLWDESPQVREAHLKKTARATSHDAGYKRRVKGNPDTRLAYLYFAALVEQVVRDRFERGQKVRDNYARNQSFRDLFIEAVWYLSRVLEDADDTDDTDDAGLDDVD